MTNVTAAVEALHERKVALLEGLDQAGVAGALMLEDQVKLLAVGLELDMDEVEQAGSAAAESALVAALVLPVSAVMAGTWFDGLLTGLILAELRRGHGSG